MVYLYNYFFSVLHILYSIEFYCLEENYKLCFIFDLLIRKYETYSRKYEIIGFIYSLQKKENNLVTFAFLYIHILYINRCTKSVNFFGCFCWQQLFYNIFHNKKNNVVQYVLRNYVYNFVAFFVHKSHYSIVSCRISFRFYFTNSQKIFYQSRRQFQCSPEIYHVTVRNLCNELLFEYII